VFCKSAEEKLGRLTRPFAYHWRQETSAMGKLSTDELEMVYKTGWKPSEYLANK